jgi:hypothetical protein|tara:strand:- start:175 stop:282 length:108 start_codon:yes stop_codon:yes gene_type:complete
MKAIIEIIVMDIIIHGSDFINNSLFKNEKAFFSDS